MIEAFFSEITVLNFLFLTVACFCAAFIDAIAGGGGLISYPAFLATGLNPHLALGTNKLAAFFSTSGSALKFARSGKIKWKLMAYLIPFSFIGAVLGVESVMLIEDKYLYPIAFVLLAFVLIYSLMNKNLGDKSEFKKLESKTIKLGIAMAFVFGFYDGFFGPGTGSFLIFSLIKIFKFDFIEASGNSKYLNLASNIASVITFMYFGKIAYIFALSMGFIMIIGSTLGAKVAITKGSRFIRPVFLIITTIVTIKMGITFFEKF